MLKQGYLRNRIEPIQITYPPDYSGQKSLSEFDQVLLISTEPRWLSPGEIELVNAYIALLPYSQHLDFTGAVRIDADDPLLDATHDELDAAETVIGALNTRNLPGGGTRSIYERVLILREQGYEGNGKKALAEGAA